MAERARPLRTVVERWLSAASSKRWKIPGFSRSRGESWGYVCIESVHPSGSLAVMLFRHDDGSSYLYPEAPGRELTEPGRR